MQTEFSDFKAAAVPLADVETVHTHPPLVVARPT